MSLSYAHGASDVALLGETIGASLERTAARTPDAEAVVSRHQQLRYTYAQLDALVDIVARGLLDLGIQRGDRIAMLSPNHAEWALVQYASAKVGAILVNVNPAYRVNELTYTLGQSGCRLMVAAPSFKTSDYVAMVDEVRPNLPALERVVFLFTEEWHALLSAGESVPTDVLRRRAREVEFDDPVSIMYTSGTTGFPKGATLSHHNLLNNGYSIGELLRYTERDRVCLPLPYYHTFGMVVGNLGCLTHSASIVLPDVAFDPGAVLATVEEERCTSLYGVPTMFIAEFEHPEFDRFDLGSLRTGLMGGSPCPVEVMKQVVSAMHMEEVAIIYGMTETTVSTQTRSDDTLDRRVATVGRPLPHVEIKIVDPASGDTVPSGEPGELCTRGYSVMAGYWDEPERTAEAVDRHGWMHTGDLAAMDADGYVNIVGRIKDMVIRGGVNIYPREIEEFLYGHPDVGDVQVIGVPDRRLGEELVAWVRLRPGATATEDDIREFCRGRIAHFKVPRYVRFTEEFPTTVTGKVQKFRMREISINELGLEKIATA